MITNYDIGLGCLWKSHNYGEMWSMSKNETCKEQVNHIWGRGKSKCQRSDGKEFGMFEEM